MKKAVLLVDAKAISSWDRLLSIMGMNCTWGVGAAGECGCWITWDGAWGTDIGLFSNVSKRLNRVMIWSSRTASDTLGEIGLRSMSWFPVSSPRFDGQRLKSLDSFWMSPSHFLDVSTNVNQILKRGGPHRIWRTLHVQTWHHPALSRNRKEGDDALRQEGCHLCRNHW